MLKETFELFCGQSAIERGLSPRTLESYRNTIKQLLKLFNLENIKLDMISTELVRQFLYNGIEEKKWKAKTYHIHYDNLNVFFKWLFLNEYIRDNPIVRIHKPRIEKTIIKPLTREEVHKILYSALLKSSKNAFLRIRNHSLFMLALHSGLRMSEIIHLSITDFDFERKTIHVRKGKGKKDRMVVITDELIAELRYYLKEHEKNIGLRTHMVFPSKSGKVFSKREFYRLINTIKKLTNIKFSSHDLRRTYATNLSMKGVSPFVIQKQLGHSDIKVTQRYVMHSENERREIIDKINLYD